MTNREQLKEWNYPEYVLNNMSDEEMEAEVEVVEQEGSRLMK